MSQTDNLRIQRTRPLIAPAILAEEMPLTSTAQRFVEQSRQRVADIVQGRDPRLLLIVGPCSVHDLDAALEYAERLAALKQQVSKQIELVMRVYFEKPRTTVGWKGYINDPAIDGSYQVNAGLRQARGLLRDITDMGIGTATEFLDTTFGQYYTDFVSWGAIGARTVESQIHRQLASGLSMPVGIKNATDGRVNVAVDALVAAAQPHLFPSLTKEGAPALLETTGNADCHLVLRGGQQPNYDDVSMNEALDQLQRREIATGLMVDCSHANSRKDPQQQIEIAQSVNRWRAAHPCMMGLMIESHLMAGRQDQPINFGQSITDACLGWEDTAALIQSLAASSSS